MRKIINDPVYGFITIDHPLVMQVTSHPYFQRLRRISQMAMAHLVYPGAMHTRLHHALGAYHLMCDALVELQKKGTVITEEECVGAKVAILLHDVGHGPYSHALENTLAQGIQHEEFSKMIMHAMNKEMNGALQTAIDIFEGTHPKKFLHQLVSGQLDVDRMDYLNRDSFFSGVSEGVIGYDRIIKMLVVHDGELMVEEKAIYSIEKFLLARRLMYAQVYLHKTVLCGEQMLKRIISRAKLVHAQCMGPLNDFINKELKDVTLEQFCAIDDTDVMMAIKHWCSHPDKILSYLCDGICNRKLLKVKYGKEAWPEWLLNEKAEQTMQAFGLNKEEVDWLVFSGFTGTNTYDITQEQINILFRDGSVKDISAVDDALIGRTLEGSIKKYYICYPSINN